MGSAFNGLYNAILEMPIFTCVAGKIGLCLVSPLLPFIVLDIDVGGDCRAIELLNGQVPEWTKGADCKSAAVGFQGSNPCLPTILLKRV